MKRIGILSDTHGVIPPQVYSFFGACDELWHAGDMGPGVLSTLQQFKPVVGVYGNIDGADVRRLVPRVQLFRCEGLKVLMTHIGGYPNHYQPAMKTLIEAEHPDLFVCGHSHILKVIYDRHYQLLHINPGAAGCQGFHRVCTLVRFVADGVPKDLEILDFPKFPTADDE